MRRTSGAVSHPAGTVVAMGRDGTATDVVDWLVSAEAAAAARRSLRRCGFHATPELVEDVVADAALAVASRMRSGPLVLDNPAAYGTVVVRNVVNGMARGADVPLEGFEDQAAPPDAQADLDLEDVRCAIEAGGHPPWLTSASLTYLTYSMHPSAVPPGAPMPLAGARPDQATAWPALWFAGMRDLFPDGDGDLRRRTRARRVRDVVDNVRRVLLRHASAADLAKRRDTSDG